MMRKADLVALLISEKKKHANTVEKNTVEINDEDRKYSLEKTASFEEEALATPSCLFLILDENLHRFPFEGMDFLSNLAVSRLPSLPFAMATALTAKSDHDKAPSATFPPVDPYGASFIVDPA